MDRIKTFVEGLDEDLSGGLPRGHIILITGTPGTMKSSLVLNILFHNAVSNNMKSLYISVEESKESLLATMRNLGMEPVDERKLFIVDVAKLRLEHQEADEARDWLKILKEYIFRRVRDEKFEIVAIDSLTALYSLVSFTNPRNELFHFFGFLRELGVTVLLICEAVSEESSFGLYREDYLADGIIQLKFTSLGESDVSLRIRIVKMRHTKVHHGYKALIVRDGKFVTTPVIAE
ncbi:MAG: ATPase domain-containing protein [Thermoplasmata archaeon]